MLALRTTDQVFHVAPSNRVSPRASQVIVSLQFSSSGSSSSRSRLRSGSQFVHPRSWPSSLSRVPTSSSRSRRQTVVRRVHPRSLEASSSWAGLAPVVGRRVVEMWRSSADDRLKNRAIDSKVMENYCHSPSTVSDCDPPLRSIIRNGAYDSVILSRCQPPLAIVLSRAAAPEIDGALCPVAAAPALRRST